MQILFKAGVLSALALAACNATPVITNVVQEGDAEMPAMDPALMEKMMKYAAPGEQHKELAQAAGKWSVARCKMYMGPGAAPMSMQGTAESESILGGRFLQERFEGEMMGQPFEGQLLMGYNNLDQQYFTIWVDTMGTGFSLAQGKESPKGTLDLRGEMCDALTPEGRPFRHVSRHKDKDHFTVELYDTLPDGKEWKVMEMEYTRSK